MSTLSLQAMDTFFPDEKTRGSSRNAGTAGSAQIVKSAELLKGQRAVAIEHNGALYRLQETKLGKLILTK